MNATRKIAVVGNAGGGKTILSRRLAQRHELPLFHVDAIQFVAGMKVRPHRESIKILTDIQNQGAWIIDGYGPLDIIEERFKAADRILFIDLPLWRHYWWCTKRQIKNIWKGRDELAEGCREASISHTMKLYRTLWKTHQRMRPELLKIFSREHLRPKMIFVRNYAEWARIYREGILS